MNKRTNYSLPATGSDGNSGLADIKAPELESEELSDCLARSKGIDGHSYLSTNIRRWLGGIAHQLPRRFQVHQDIAADRATRLLGTEGFVLGDRIFLRNGVDESLDTLLRHELIHLAQVQLARQSSRVGSPARIEWEANLLADSPSAVPVRIGADPNRIYPLVWFVAIGIGAYIVLRPSVVNAPGPRDKTYASPSTGQILGEAIALFVIPGGAFKLAGRVGFGFLGSLAVSGAAVNVSLRGVSDAAAGSLSPPLLYLFDAATGAVIGFVVPGGVRLIGRSGTRALDSLASYGLRKSDIALTRLLAQEASRAPLTATHAQQILQTRGMSGQVSEWWLNRRGVILLYRGQGQATSRILSPLAREQGVAASERMVARLRAARLSDSEIAGYTARWHTQRVPGSLAPADMAGQPLGAVGIPTSRLPGIAANFGDEGVIYVIRLPRTMAIQPQGWQGLQLENEFVILNQVPPGTILKMIPARRVAPITIDDLGRIVPGG